MRGIFLEALTRSGTIYQEQCDAPLQTSHQRCGCRSWWHVNQLPLKRASLGPAIVAVQQLDGVTLDAVHLIAKVALPVDL